jgi:micrococcal nuclease
MHKLAWMNYANNGYKAQIVRWVDGDTVELLVDLGQDVLTQSKYRLARIDAPETALRKGVTEKEKAAGLLLKRNLTQHHPPGTEVWIQTSKSGKFGRYLIELWYRSHTDTWVNLSDFLLNQDLALPYE